MPIEIHGKEYVTVAERVQMLHGSDLTEITLDTQIISDDAQRVVMKCSLEIDGNSYTGIAQETKGSSAINKTSAYENCETSAVGRALGFAGFGSVEAIASADEVKHAIEQQGPRLASEKQINYIKKLAEDWAHLGNLTMDSVEFDNNGSITEVFFDELTIEDASKIIESCK